MNKKLRIVFTVLSALCLVCAIPVGIFADFLPAIIVLVCALLFFLLMLFFKRQQEREELKKNPPAPRGDFFNPVKKSDGEEDSIQNTDDGIKK